MNKLINVALVLTILWSAAIYFQPRPAQDEKEHLEMYLPKEDAVLYTGGKYFCSERTGHLYIKHGGLFYLDVPEIGPDYEYIPCKYRSTLPGRHTKKQKV